MALSKFLNQQPNAQRGAALVVSLLLLAVVTVIGVSGMQHASSELKLAGSTQDRARAFAAAEAALTQVERALALSPPDPGKLYNLCVGSGCFNATCAGGLCFGGKYKNGDTEWDCTVVDPAATSERVTYWSDATLNVWGDTSKHQTLAVDQLDTDVKYIIEFLCYVQRDASTTFSAATAAEKNNGAPLFRITAFAQGDALRGRVMLQSTYKVLAGH
jgi:type IV pilus assembly protein PilX